MTTTFKCKYCGRQNEISEALTQQIEEQVLTTERAKHRTELEKAIKETEEKAVSKAKSELELVIRKLQESESDEKERNKKFQDQILELTKELRKARQERDDTKIDMQKELLEKEEKIRQEAEKKAQEEQQLKIAEKDKQLNDALKTNEELRRKLQQGSQQTQGEVLELELEEILRKEFPQDNIREVKKGQRGADIIEEVIDKRGKNCGIILWESKNAQWSNSWIGKLKEDQRQIKAHLAVLVATIVPEEIKTFNYKDGVWITTRKMIVPLALALRFDLVRINYEKLANVGKNEKMEVLYRYVTSLEFKQRIEAIVEAFSELQEEVEREKRWFQTKWARQDKQLRKLIDHTQGMYGDLQSVIGKSLPAIKTLQLESGED